MITTKPKRKTLQLIPYYPKPYEIYKDLMASPGWPYKSDRKESYLKRDRCLASILYIAELRISEALRLVKNQFQEMEDHVYVKAILLSKRKPGKIAFRDARLPLQGDRAKFTTLVLEHLAGLEDKDRLFPWSLEVKVFDTKHTYRTKDGQVKRLQSFQLVGTKRAWQVVHALLPNWTEHWLRAYGEDYLYDMRDHDILAVADEVKIDARTLQLYLRKRHEKYPAV